MEGTKPRTASSIGMFDMLKGAGMLIIVFAHTAELYPMQAVSGLSLTAFFPFIYREALMAAFFIASGYGFRKPAAGCRRKGAFPPAAQRRQGRTAQWHPAGSGDLRSLPQARRW